MQPNIALAAVLFFIAVCDPSRGPFTPNINNPYFPLVVGTRLVFVGDDEGTAVRLEITILDQTVVVAGVTTQKKG